MLTPQQINAAAEQYAENENSAYTNDLYGFTAGADFAQEANRKELQQLVEDYERRLKTLGEMIASPDYLPYDKERFKGKAEFCRSIIADLNRLLNPVGTPAQNEE